MCSDGDDGGGEGTRLIMLCTALPHSTVTACTCYPHIIVYNNYSSAPHSDTIQIPHLPHLHNTSLGHTTMPHHIIPPHTTTTTSPHRHLPHATLSGTIPTKEIFLCNHCHVLQYLSFTFSGESGGDDLECVEA